MTVQVRDVQLRDITNSPIPAEVPSLGVTVLGSQAEVVPTRYALHQNHPNPFNGRTTIPFELPEGGMVRLTIHNPLGQLVRELVEGRFDAGVYGLSWDGRDTMGMEVSSGIYLYRLDAGTFQDVRRMILIK